MKHLNQYFTVWGDNERTQKKKREFASTASVVTDDPSHADEDSHARAARLRWH